MSKYKPYPSYKNSGVEWLGDVPSEWNNTRLGNIANITASGIDKKIIKNEEKVKIINFTDIHKAKDFVLNNTNQYMVVTTTSDKRNKHKVLKGDLIFTPSSETVDDIGISALVNDEMFNTSFSYHVLRCSFLQDINHSFKKYLTNNTLSLSQFSSKARGTTRQTLSRDDFKTLYIPIPPLTEQQAIADFLDNATSKIDTLIAKQQDLIKLLKEKRQAVISHAVTKGLDPTVEFKDSGVEWLGDVPKHWLKGRLKNVLKIRNGKDYKHVEVEVNGYPVYGSGGVFKLSSKYLHDGESILFGRKGTVDRPLIVNGKFWTVDTMFYTELGVNTCIKYIYAQSKLFPFNLLSTSTALPSMTQEDLSELHFIIPPLQEQQAIADYLDDKATKIDALVDKATHSIDLLKEKRVAIISAAVTGKIDVRGVV